VPPVEAPGRGPSALTVSEVAVRFGGVSALGSVSISVEPGSVTGLIGPNGAGKTTLFNVISGLQVPERGSVQLFDIDVTSMKPHHRARLGLARTFQRLEVFGSLSASENVQVGLESDVSWWDMRRLRRRRPGGKRSAKGSGDQDGSGVAGRGQPGATTCERLLSGVGLGGLGSRQASDMSTGLARMVELARALAIGPKLLLLDEPGSGLDEQESAALGDLLSKLAAGGMAVLLVEHDMELVMRVCDQIYVLDFGDIIASGTPEQIRRDPMVQAAYLGEVDSTSGSGPSPGQPPDTRATGVADAGSPR
jgi:branched-chain amino acid transport system ATP-binding protein